MRILAVVTVVLLVLTSTALAQPATPPSATPPGDAPAAATPPPAETSPPPAAAPTAPPAAAPVVVAPPPPAMLPLAGYANGGFFIRDPGDWFVLFPKGRLQVDWYNFLNRGDVPAGVVPNSSADPRPKDTIFVDRKS